MYYSATPGNWQLLEERVDENWSQSSSTDDYKVLYIWGARYIDDIIARKVSTLGGTPTARVYYHLTDALFSTVAILDDAAKLVERVSYDAYGHARHHRAADLTGNGGVGTADQNLLNNNMGNYGVGDLNRDGVVDNDDLALLQANWGIGIGSGQLSQTDNVIGFASYVFNAEHAGGGLYNVRFRVYSPDLGRWLTRDPIGYVDGMGLYEYVRSGPVVSFDPFGLAAVCHSQRNKVKKDVNVNLWKVLVKFRLEGFFEWKACVEKCCPPSLEVNLQIRGSAELAGMISALGPGIQIGVGGSGAIIERYVAGGCDGTNKRERCEELRAHVSIGGCIDGFAGRGCIKGQIAYTYKDCNGRVTHCISGRVSLEGCLGWVCKEIVLFHVQTCFDS